MSLWSGLASIISKISPLIGGLLGGPAGIVVGGMVGSALGVAATPDAIEKAIQTDPESYNKLKALESERLWSLQQLQIMADATKAQEETKQLTTINTTFQAEIASTDKFKSYWRPLFGYIVSIAWGMQTLAIIFCMVYGAVHNPQAKLWDTASSIFESIDWTIVLGVLGINITQRSKDKAREIGLDPGSVVDVVKKVFKR